MDRQYCGRMRRSARPRQQISNGQILLVASGGGHLRQLYELNKRFPTNNLRLWAAPKNALSSSLLQHEDYSPLKYNGPRSIMGILRNSARLFWATRHRDIRAVVSTGANHAIAAVPTALWHSAPYIFIDTAARVEGPSLTGRILAGLPWVHVYCQYEHLATRRWKFVGSVFDGFETDAVAPSEIALSPQDLRGLKVVVTVGAMEELGFLRLVKACQQVIPSSSSVTWQIGPTEVQDDSVPTAERFLSSSELESRIAEADVVISHAGTGSALTCLQLGKVPILIPRSSTHGEHIDDHQQQVASFLESRGLAIATTPEGLSLPHLDLARRSSAYRLMAGDSRLDELNGLL